MFKWLCAAAIAGSLALPAVSVAGQYGDVQVVNAGPASESVFQLTSSTSPGPGWAGVYQDFTAAPIAVNTITTLSTDYKMATGPFFGGAPRFSLVDSSNNEAWIYFGAPQTDGSYTDANGGAWGTTGNYADGTSLDLRVQSNGFGGYNSGYPPITWADFLSHVGSTGVYFVSLDLDGGWGTGEAGQRLLVNNFRVNDSVMSPGGSGVAVPEPAGWALMILGFGGVGAALRRRARVALTA